jgi:hypothetical protein
VNFCPLPGNFNRKLFESTCAVSSSRMRKLQMFTGDIAVSSPEVFQKILPALRLQLDGTHSSHAP